MEEVKTAKEKFSFFLQGDLNQMAAQRIFLASREIPTQQQNVYPCLKPSDVRKALALIYMFKTAGWWHYQTQYVELGICTVEEFKKH